MKENNTCPKCKKGLLKKQMVIKKSKEILTCSNYECNYKEDT